MLIAGKDVFVAFWWAIFQPILWAIFQLTIPQATKRVILCILLIRQLNIGLDWRDSLAACKAQNVGVAGLRRGFATKQDAKIAAKMSSV